ncbi:MAG: SUMF1/EgtB/PvdO family nonheme iron enzyme [Candidatus Latescibacterota bacterium]|nr:SUMF1/EgtB/PvdO family nonheme iron enzyme [Candidatus Latescibacterota bacterium]
MSSLLLTLVMFIGCGPEPIITTDDGSTMVLIPEGEFPMGGKREDLTDAPDGNMLTYNAERPVHTVRLGAYYIDKFEVTNAQYDRFLQEASNRHDHPNQPVDINHDRRYVTPELMGQNQPTVGLNWFDAYAYCDWAGKRLPSEAEWEYAARGGDGRYRVYPWGNDSPDAEGIWWANYRPHQGAAADGYRNSAPVGSFPDGVSPFGIHDLSGNAEEWIQDWHSNNYYSMTDGAQNPPGPAQGDRRVVKGGSYGSPAHQVRIAMRFRGNPIHKGPKIGFRCVTDP